MTADLGLEPADTTLGSHSRLHESPSLCRWGFTVETAHKRRVSGR